MNRPIRPLDRADLRPLTRAALALKRSATLREAGAEAAKVVALALQQELQTAFTCAPRLLESAPRAAGLPEGCCYAVFALSADGRRAIVEMDTGFAAAMVARLSGGSGAAFAPGELSSAEAAALGYLALRALFAARGIALVESQLAPRFLFVARDADAALALLSQEQRWVAVELELSLGETRGFGRLLLPASSAHRIARIALRTAERRPLAPEISRATLEARLVAGSADLGDEELAALAEGDAIVLSGLSRDAAGLGGPATLLFDHFHLRGALRGRAFTVASVVDALPPESLMHDSPTQVTSLPIELQVELARVKLPLARLDGIKPGSVLELDAALCDPVVLRIGGRAVAQAELVDIDGELGARILALLP